MRILVHIHTLNDEEVIERSLQAILDQTLPLEEILLVDNGSKDGTLDRLLPKQVKVIRHLENYGTSGAVVSGLEYGLANNYDWIWILDADSLPHKDALEKLVNLYESLDSDTKMKVGVLSSSHDLAESRKLVYGRRLTPQGPRVAKLDPNRPYHECDSTIWSGSLFNLRAVRAVGLPRAGKAPYWQDLSLDYGDIEFCHSLRKAGYRVFVHRLSMIDHPLGHQKLFRIFGRTFFGSTNHSATRRYLYFRNLVYFWLYIYPRRHWFMLGVWFSYRFMITIFGICLLEEDSYAKSWACIRGLWDGFRKHLDHRFE